MDPPAKIKLVESLCKILESVGVLGTTSNQVVLLVILYWSTYTYMYMHTHQHAYNLCEPTIV